MRWTHFIFLQFFIFMIVAGLFYSHKDRVIAIKKPPASLAQWYKPVNKRQVWLHNMFKLRREVQAVKLYADNKDSKNLEKWAARLSQHYLKIAEMTPEWKKKLDKDAMAALQDSVKNNRYQDVNLALDKLNNSCKSCHDDYRIVTASMYRSPDFTSIEINPSTPYKKHMKQLMEQVNAIKIASEDGMLDVALSYLPKLNKGMNTLGESCSTCHKKDKQVYPSDSIIKTFASLEQSLKTGTLKQQGENLGTLAVLACARCHGTHRQSFDNRKTFSGKPNWLKLIQH